jgi:predicted phage gp36 major capsid-like protein
MAKGAKLTTIDAVPEMSAAIEQFRAEAMAALEELEMEIRRAVEWIQHDRLDHWNREIHRGWDRISESRVQLQQAMTSRRIGNDDPSCIDEKKAVERAKRRLDQAQEKLEATKHWARTIERAVNEYIGSRTALATWIDCEAPKAVSALQRIADQLEKYLAIQPEAMSHGTSSGMLVGMTDLMKLAQTSEFNLFKQEANGEADVVPPMTSEEAMPACEAGKPESVAAPAAEVEGVAS